MRRETIVTTSLGALLAITITLHLEGFRTVTQNVYVAPDSTVKLQLSMEKLTPGEASAPPPLPARTWPGSSVPRQAPLVPPGT